MELFFLICLTFKKKFVSLSPQIIVCILNWKKTQNIFNLSPNPPLPIKLTPRGSGNDRLDIDEPKPTL